MDFVHILSWEGGAFEEGEEYAAECLSLYRQIGYLSGYANVLGDRGISWLQAGLFEEGLKSIQESIDVYQNLGDRVGIIKGYYFQSMALVFAGQLTEAESQLQKCLSIGEEYCDFIETVFILMAIVKTHRGQYPQAREYARAGLERAKEINNQMCIGRALSTMAMVALGESATAEAERLAQRAVTVYINFGQKTEMGMALAAQGFAVCQNGDLVKAQGLFYEALSLAAAHKDRPSLLYALTGIAYLQSYMAQAPQAIETYTLAARYPIVANSILFRDLVKTRIDSAAATLPSETAEAAVKRGQARDLEAYITELIRSENDGTPASKKIPATLQPD